MSRPRPSVYRPPAQTIVPRTTQVTSIKARNPVMGAEPHMLTVGWRARCENCHAKPVFMLHQHARAVTWATGHKCK